jgi:transposase
MTVNKFIRKLLNLKELVVCSFDLNQRKRRLLIFVKPYKNGCRCPLCGRRGKIKHQSKLYRLWHDLPVYGCRVELCYCPREILCCTHGRIQEDIPWADTYSRITYRFEFAMLVYCQIMTQKAAVMLLHIAPTTLSDLLHRSVARARQNHRIRNLEILGIDEISYCKGHKYATLVYDLKKARGVWVGKGKGRETIDQFFNQELSDHQKRQIRWATCDMSRAYIAAIEAHCPNVTLVLDRFHIVKALNEAVDEVRKQQWRLAAADQRKALMGLRWLLFKHPSKRSQKDTHTLTALKKGNRRIHRAWVLKDEFERFWNYNAPWAAERFMKRWTTTVLKSRLQPMRDFVTMIRKHSHRILPYLGSRLTNAIGEGINRIIKIVKNRASGFRHLSAFSDMIFLTVGDLNIPAQIPKRFRTI